MIKKIAKPKQSQSGIKSSQFTDAQLRFSFKLFDGSDEDVCPKDFPEGYTRKLMERLRDLSSWTVNDFANKYYKAIRNHTIDWAGTTRINGFANLNDHFNAYPAYQFSITTNEHGRVHGIIIDDTFYIIWLDCNHNLYA